jgi:ABC-type phosphate transport system permease subunit
MRLAQVPRKAHLFLHQARCRQAAAIFLIKAIVLMLVLVLVFMLAYPLINSRAFFAEIPVSNWLSFDWRPNVGAFGFGTALTGSFLLVLTTLPLSLLGGLAHQSATGRQRNRVGSARPWWAYSKFGSRCRRSSSGLGDS